MKKEKYLQVFNYLLEFSKIRSKAVRDIINAPSQYIDIIWLSDIPKNELIDCILDEDFNKDADYWIKISKPLEPELPKFPPPPPNLEKWIVEDSLLNKEEFPILNEYIFIDDNNKFYLVDNPKIKEEFDEYINTKWFEDSEMYWEEYKNYEIQYKAYIEVNSIYKKLFLINNKSQQFGEEYELLMGLGLLNFKANDESPLICRHILTQRVEINFEDPVRPTIAPSLSNDIQIETDSIIDLFERFNSNDIIEAERKAIEFINEKNIAASLFDKQNKETIQIIADRFSPDGLFKDEIIKPKDAPKRPTIFYAPALMLRKRNTRSFTALYEKIIADIEKSDETDIPALNDIIDLNEYNPNNNGDFDTLDSKKNDIIYFPKKYNDEQIEIIKKANRNNKVLVQGPPGTGKSHTIANLICHFLANGKKILITAYTKRALEVLKEKLPDDFKSLSVNLLSGDSASIQDLETSVNSINDKLSNTNLSDHYKEKDRFEKELLTLKEKRADKTNELLKIKEKNTRKLEINKYYQGTLTQIAEKIEHDTIKFNWFKDEYFNISNSDIFQQVENFIGLTQHYKEIDCNKFDYKIPDKNEIFTFSEFEKYVEIRKYIIEKNISYNSLNIVKCSDFSKTKEFLDSLYEICLSIEKNTHSKKALIIQDVQNSNFNWEQKLKDTKKLIDILKKIDLKSLDKNIEIRYPPNKSWITLKNDANKLLHYLKSGNKLDGALFELKKPFLPKEIKEKLYFKNSVIVNGSPCDTKWEFSSVIEDIRIRQVFQDLAKIWNANIQNLSKNYFEYFEAFSQLCLDTNDLLDNLKRAKSLVAEIQIYSSLTIQGYNSNTIKKYIEDVERNYILKLDNDFNSRKDRICFYLSDDEFHPIALDIKKTILELDVFKFEQLLTKVDQLKSQKQQYDDFKKLENELKTYVPILVDEIINDTFDINNITNLNEAIHFKHAESEIKKLLDEGYENDLMADLFSYDEREEKLVSKIASLKAWVHVLTNLQNNRSLRQYLEAWVQAVRKIGKTGKGKRALRFRKEAQNQMDHCKTTVPCWIMPLYKVSETISPEQGMYDYVIIDEASQLGPDAIFLLYISKNIIIVGDDKQTSPEYVGVNADAMAPFINKHLKGIPFANFFDIAFSFFDHAKLFCEGLTVLREHFRCMPEIIEFSNKLFYAPDGKGLYPLKQYSENRLEPLKHVFCQNGFVEGQYQNIRNKVEAERIVDTFSELISDKRYDNKTVGVICLQGNAQGALIENLLLQRIGEKQFKERKIVCGNSASFQGDERDIIFLSLVTAHNHNRSALTRPEDERRFNVAVSRAIEQIWLFHSVQMEDINNTNDLRYKLLDHFINFKNIQEGWKRLIPIPKVKKMGEQPPPFESWFEVDVYNDIVSRSYSVIPQYEVAKGKYRVDLVAILPDGTKIAIECDGDIWHGAEQFQNDLMRQKVLERCGWQFFRIKGGEYYSNRIKALEPLWKILNSKPNHQTTEKIIDDKNDIEHEETTKDSQPHNNNLSFATLHNNRPHPLAAIEPKNVRQSEILVFTDKYNVYKIANNSYYSKQHILDSINFEKDEKPIYITSTSDFSGYMLFGFENGKVAKIFMKSYETETQRKRLKNAYNNNSKIVYIDHLKEDVELVAISSIKKILIFNTAHINPKESRNSQGNQVMKSKNNSIMQKIKKVNHVSFQNIDYYKKDIPAIGNYLLSGDRI
ncbi:MAG: AAA domain-containing protein [Candidatus Zhuqueibacterota bacterium]